MRTLGDSTATLKMGNKLKCRLLVCSYSYNSHNIDATFDNIDMKRQKETQRLTITIINVMKRETVTATYANKICINRLQPY